MEDITEQLVKICEEKNRSTVSAPFVIEAIKNLGFGSYEEQLKDGVNINVFLIEVQRTKNLISFYNVFLKDGGNIMMMIGSAGLLMWED